MILAVRTALGRVHDFKLWRQSRIALSEETLVLADSGYIGLQKQHRNVLLPHKRSKKKVLTAEQKAHNRSLSKQRILVEHIIRCCKVFRITKAEYRGKHRHLGRTWNLIAMLVNLKRGVTFPAPAAP